MKGFTAGISLIITAMLILVAAVAFADSQADYTHKTITIFSAQKATGTSAINSSAVHMPKSTKAAFVLAGYSSNNGLTTNTATTYQNGTSKVQCGATASGPWVTLKDHLGNALAIADYGTWTMFNVDTTCDYIRAVWTPVAISTNRTINVYLLGFN